MPWIPPGYRSPLRLLAPDRQVLLKALRTSRYSSPHEIRFTNRERRLFFLL